MEGSSSHWKNTGSSEVYVATATSFQTYIDAKSAGLRGGASERMWNMEWIAVGYTC